MHSAISRWIAAGIFPLKSKFLFKYINYEKNAALYQHDAIGFYGITGM
jgi:hypothetical protein